MPVDVNDAEVGVVLLDAVHHFFFELRAAGRGQRGAIEREQLGRAEGERHGLERRGLRRRRRRHRRYFRLGRRRRRDFGAWRGRRGRRSRHLIGIAIGIGQRGRPVAGPHASAGAALPDGPRRRRGRISLGGGLEGGQRKRRRSGGERHGQSQFGGQGVSLFLSY